MIMERHSLDDGKSFRNVIFNGNAQNLFQDIIMGLLTAAGVIKLLIGLPNFDDNLGIGRLNSRPRRFLDNVAFVVGLTH